MQCDKQMNWAISSADFLFIIIVCSVPCGYFSRAYFCSMSPYPILCHVRDLLSTYVRDSLSVNVHWASLWKVSRTQRACHLRCHKYLWHQKEQYANQLKTRDDQTKTAEIKLAARTRRQSPGSALMASCIDSSSSVLVEMDSIRKTFALWTDNLNRCTTMKSVCCPSMTKTVARVLSGFQAGRTERMA